MINRGEKPRHSMANAETKTMPESRMEEDTDSQDQQPHLYLGTFEYYAFTVLGWAVGTSPLDAIEKLKGDGSVPGSKPDAVGLCRYPLSPENDAYDIKFFLPQVKELEIIYSPFHQVED